MPGLLYIYIVIMFLLNWKKREELLHILYKLLTRKKLLTQDKSRHDTMNDHFYKKAVKDILNSNYGKQFSEIFTSEILSSKLSLFEFPIDDYSIKECFKKNYGKIS